MTESFIHLFITQTLLGTVPGARYTDTGKKQRNALM